VFLLTLFVSGKVCRVFVLLLLFLLLSGVGDKESLPELWLLLSKEDSHTETD